jgi:methylmalonyl-CoA mutase
LTKIELNLVSMTYHAIHDLLKHSFPNSNKENWAGAAAKEIQGKNPFETLSWQSEDQINFFPYYNKQDAENLNYLKNFQFLSSKSVNDSPREWKNLPFISVHDFQIANDVALNHLQNGADGIVFDIRELKVVDINRLLAEINWTYCDVSFLVTSGHVCDSIIEYVRKKNYPESHLEGMLLWETSPQIDHQFLESFKPFEKFRSLGLYIPSSSPVCEISEALAKIAKLMDELTDKGFDKRYVWRNITLSCSIGINFLGEIAKLQALRFLLYQLANAFGIADYRFMDFKIHCRSEKKVNEKLEPHSNILNGTFAAFSAVAGGCNSLSIKPEDENNAMLSRISRNISNIIREESYLNKVANPIAGSYAIESMIHQIAQAAWLDFQNKMKSA